MSQAVAPHPNRARIGRHVGKVIFSTLYRGTALHPERVPLTGPVILVANHAAFLDGPLVFGLAPRAVSFLVKQEAFSGFWGWTIRNVGQIPIDRSVGDRAALASASAVLEGGGAVGIFPEGNRGDGEVHQVNHGAAWIALRTDAQIVPVAVSGTRVPGATKDDWPAFRSRLLVDFGDPFRLVVDPSAPGRDRLRLASDHLRDALASHVRRSRVENGSSTDVH